MRHHIRRQYRGMALRMLIVVGTATVELFTAAPLLRAQTPASSFRGFEVASVKINKSNERTRVNGNPAAGRLVIIGMTVKEVIQGAYVLQSFELVNADSPI